jgi:ABC-type glutathione transport system ATPase component
MMKFSRAFAPPQAGRPLPTPRRTPMNEASSAYRENGTMTASTLLVRGLKKHYGARQVVHDVSLRVDSGEVIGLLGPNGAGKTTSFYMIVGLVPS